MIRKNITGIQQIGIGVVDFKTALNWYKDNFGMNIKVFEEAAVAELMGEYTENQARERIAALTLNMQGGGGFEVWQHTGKKPKLPEKEIKIGDIGIFNVKIKTTDINIAYNTFKNNDDIELLGDINDSLCNRKHFFLKDPFGNVFQFVETGKYYSIDKNANAGVLGATIGVSNIEKSLEVYQDILQYDKIIYDKTDYFEDFKMLNGGKTKMRRVLLQHSTERNGRFSEFFGPTEIELVQLIDEKPNHVYEGRMWGDPGFIHICFDIVGMDKLRKECEAKNYPFTVDSSESFDMGEAAGHFSYISDPDGIPIEFVETHKVPIIKKLGIFMNLKNKPADKKIPRWMINTLKWKKIR